jgi:hypothetical protein
VSLTSNVMNCFFILKSLNSQTACFPKHTRVVHIINYTCTYNASNREGITYNSYLDKFDNEFLNKYEKS